MKMKLNFLLVIGLVLSVSVKGLNGQEDEIVNEDEIVSEDELLNDDHLDEAEDVEAAQPPEEINEPPIEVISDTPQLSVRSGAYQLQDGLTGDEVETDAVDLEDEAQNERQLSYQPPTDETNNDNNDPYFIIDGPFLPPTTYRPTDTPYVITTQRLNQIRGRFLYWFYDRGGNEDHGDYQRDIHASSPQIHKNFNFQLPFFGFRFNYTRVSINGYLQFSDPPDHYTYPMRFPIRDWPSINDPSFIGIFFSRCRIGAIRPEEPDQRRAGVYFRMDRDLQARTDQLGVEMRERVTWDIREGVIGSENFFPKHAVTITWKNMSFAGGIDPALFVTNSFQMVLATDEVFTYAIFNYVEIRWSSHTEAGGDTTLGEGGVPAYIGFNAGNGTRSYEYQPYSQASVLRDLTQRGWANGFPGRHIFRIDENILMGTCNKDIDGANLPLMFAPESGNMLGGTVVNITGPCFRPTDRVSCRFDTEWVVGVVVDVNRAVCIQPRFYHNGYARFEIAINNEPYKWKGRFFVETPATATEKIFFTDDSVHQRYPPEVRITWDRFNLTTNQNLQLQISLWGYKEVTIRPQFEFIDILEVGVANTGEFIINPQNYRNRDNIMHNDMQFGFLQINLTSPSSINGVPISPILWSRPIPLGWYFAPQWERLHGRRWPHEMCNNWLRTDRFLRNFASQVWVCPCTLEHALLDKGRFMPDWECDRDSNPTCRYHWGGIHCVRSGSPSFEGSGQQCCYDKNGFLMLSYDQMWGSRPHRSHDFGFTPYNEANKVPSLSHWFHDMIPFYQCCSWQEEQAVGCETFRFERRPSQDCVAYQSPGVAGIFGDPHLVTFDDLQYTFNGKGEFVLVRVDRPHIRLDIQGRFEQVARNIWGPVNATHLTSIAATSNQSIPIEIRLRPQHAQWRYRLDVFADGKRIYFDRPSLRVQYFPGVTVYQPTYILNQSEIIVMFSSGAGVEVVENKGFMTARIYLPWTYVNQTRGLFGNWSFNMNDDFTTPTGNVVPVDLNNFRSAHENFAEHWRLTDREQENIGVALFVREFGRTAAYYNDDTFVPNFIREPRDFLPANRSQDIERAAELCQDSYQCRYDFGMTLNRDMAEFTKNYLSSIVNIKETNARRVISCGILETPRFGRKSNFFFVPGTRVQFECNQDFILIGDVRRHCEDNGRWNLPDYGFTECLRKQEYSSRTLGWTWAIICAVMLPFIVVLICIGWRILKRKKAEEKEDTYMIRSRHIDPDESMKINSDDDSIPYKKGLDSPSAVEPEKTADNDQLATSPSPGFQYEAAQPFGQNLNLDENFDSNNPKSKELGYPDMYTYNTASPFNAASPAPYGGARLSESPTAFQPASTAAFQPASPTTFQPASPTTFQPASPTAFQPASPALFNPVSPAPSNPPFNEPFQPNQEVVYPSTSHNQRQQPNQQWSGETEIN